ncbi:MAG: hypothetical protein JWR83_2323 [Aeromicrobium sp.]|nr:hypothetical protein [Aeromicrobium sp.]
MGLLRVRGTIELHQFWPTQSSDADTTKVKVRLEPPGFEFSVDGTTGFGPVDGLSDATVTGETGVTPVVKRPKAGGEYLTVRVEGVDAPELHYRPVIPVKGLTPQQRDPFNKLNGEFRQNGGEAATVALATRLAQLAPAEIPCIVSTVVDHPNEVFDVYGRFIGVITATAGGSELVVNDWLLNNGWALPSFYTSSTVAEIDRLTALADHAWNHGLGVWPQYSYKVVTLDHQQRFRSPSSKPTVGLDTGPFDLPKIFRRFSQWQIARDANLAVPATFRQFVSSGTGNAIHTLDDFRSQGLAAAPVHYIGDYLNDNNELTLAPEEIIFREKAATLHHANGTAFKNF